MVMKDIETGSEWVQLLGASSDGPLKGKQLHSIPAIWTDWKTWREAHPETSVLMMSRVVPIYRHVEQYANSPQEREYFGRLQWGLERDGKTRSWPFRELAKEPVVNDTIGDLPVVLVFDSRESTVTAFRRELDHEVLTLRRDGSKLVDDQSHTVWDPFTGEGVAGPYRGKHLNAVAGIVSLVQKWRQFHPQTEVWKAEGQRRSAPST
jgi:hypothetical protein